MKAGVPLNKIDCYRELLEEEAFSLTSSRHLSDFIDVVGKDERKKEKEEIEDFSIPPSSLLAAARDRASVNNVAKRHLKILYPNLVDIGCFNHTLDHVGEKMATPNLEKFMKSWVSLVAHSARSRNAFKATTGQFPKSYSETRWWSKYEMMVQVHDLFGDIPAFVNGGQIPKVTTRKLQNILNEQQKLALLKVELAITVDAMKPFVQSTYQLEGDGSLCLQAYQIVRKLEAEMRNLHFPNCSAVIRNIANGNIALQRQSEAYAMACIQPAYDYFASKFLNSGDQLQPAVEIFKAACDG